MLIRYVLLSLLSLCQRLKHLRISRSKTGHGRRNRTAYTSLLVLFSGVLQANDESINWSYQDVPVRQLLTLLAEQRGLNLVMSEAVGGRVSLHLDDVPWEQALTIILDLQGLHQQRKGNVLLIGPIDELQTRETRRTEIEKVSELNAHLHEYTIKIKHVAADDIAQALQASEQSLLSERGYLLVNSSSNQIILVDTPLRAERIKRVIDRFDQAPKQIQISSKMVSVRSEYERALGIQLGLSTTNPTASTTDGIDRLGISLPVGNAVASMGMRFTRFDNERLLDLELSALELENNGKVIASPKIVVSNQQTAYIEQGTEIPFLQNAGQGATSLSFKKAVLSLEATPRITADGMIMLRLTITQDSKGETVNTSEGPAVAIDTQEIKTEVLIATGTTLVLGGVYQKIATDHQDSVPYLSEIPLIGRLFTRDYTAEEERELLVFVTPTILDHDHSRVTTGTENLH